MSSPSPAPPVTSLEEKRELVEGLLQFDKDGWESLVEANMFSPSPPPSPQENPWTVPPPSWPQELPEDTLSDPPLSPPSGIDPHLLSGNNEMVIDQEEDNEEVAGRDWNRKGKGKRQRDSQDKDELESEDEQEEEEVSPWMAEAMKIVEPDVRTVGGSTSAQGYHMLAPFYRLSKEDQQVIMKVSEEEILQMYRERIQKEKNDMEEMRSPQAKRIRRTRSPSLTPSDSDSDMSIYE
jgi:hypothetical protein